MKVLHLHSNLSLFVFWGMECSFFLPTPPTRTAAAGTDLVLAVPSTLAVEGRNGGRAGIAIGPDASRLTTPWQELGPGSKAARRAEEIGASLFK